MGNIDAGDFALAVGGKVIREFSGLRDWKRDKTVGFNEGPGGQAFGFVHQRSNNKVSFSFAVRETSPDLQYLQKLVNDETEVPIRAYVAKNLDSYDPGQEIALGAKICIVSGGSRGKGQGDPEDVTFDVIGIDPITEYKSGDADTA